MVRPHRLLLATSALPLLVAAAPGAAQAPADAQALAVRSPAGGLVVTVALDPAGALTYALADSAGLTYVEPSRLGIATVDHEVADGMRWVGSRLDSGRATYALATGKQREVDRPYRSAAVDVARIDRDDTLDLTVEVRLFDDGIALRYVLGEGFGVSPLVRADLTEFALPRGLTAWRQPYDRVTPYGPGYERYFERADVGAADTAGRGFVFPLYAYDARRHLLLHEAAGDGGASGAHLGNDGATYRLRGPLPPEARGLHDTLSALGPDRATPWRVVVAGGAPQVVAASTLVTDVAPARVPGDFSWVRPGRATWSWWSDWDSPRDYAKLTRFVDFAAERGWAYSLVDANWDEMTGGTLPQLAAYARSRGVGLLVWYNSGGPHNVITERPRGRMLDPVTRRREMATLRDLGVAGIKVDFFQSDKRAVMEQYRGILADAAEFGLLVNFHGCTTPRGLRRAYPNLVTIEAVKGAETYAFGEDFPGATPSQHTVLPLTRNAIGPMDYTPVTFTDRDHARLTTDAHELALAVLFESGIQHFADDVDAYRALPPDALAMLDGVPVAWDEVRHLGGVPGEWIALARRRGADWYVAVVNGTGVERSVTLDVRALGGQPLRLFEDAGPRALTQRDVDVAEGLPLTLRPYGGAVGTPREPGGAPPGAAPEK